jgi:hypothetical protein
MKVRSNVIVRVQRLTKVVTLAAALLILFTGTAQAYLDPGSVSLFFQMLVASVLGAVVVMRPYWQKVKGFFIGNKKGKDDEEEADTGGA